MIVSVAQQIQVMRQPIILFVLVGGWVPVTPFLTSRLTHLRSRSPCPWPTFEGGQTLRLLVLSKWLSHHRRFMGFSASPMKPDLLALFQRALGSSPVDGGLLVGGFSASTLDLFQTLRSPGDFVSF